MATILPYNGVYPRIADDAFISPSAVIIGDVEIGAKASIWYGCVVRGDVNHIRIGEGTNIQDGTVIHVNRIDGPTIIGNGVTVGHMALLHACIIGDHAFIGMGARIIDYVHIESKAMVAAAALMSPRKVVKSGELWAGVPAKFFRSLTPEEIEYIWASEKNYINLAAEHRAMLKQ